MARRIEIELTSARPDGAWTWRAAGALKPRGVLDGALLTSGAKPGDVLRVDAEFEIDGITIIAVLPPKDKRAEPERLEIIGPPRSTAPDVTTSLARPLDESGRRPRRSPGGEGGGESGGRDFGGRDGSQTGSRGPRAPRGDRPRVDRGSRPGGPLGGSTGRPGGPAGSGSGRPGGPGSGGAPGSRGAPGDRPGGRGGGSRDHDRDRDRDRNRASDADRADRAGSSSIDEAATNNGALAGADAGMGGIPGASGPGGAAESGAGAGSGSGEQRSGAGGRTGNDDRAGGRGPRPGRGPRGQGGPGRGEGERAGADRSGGDRRRGTGGGAGYAPGAGRPAGPRPAGTAEGGERPKPRRLNPGSVHRNALLDALPPEQRPIAEQVIRGGIPAVRTAIHLEGEKAQAEGRPKPNASALLAIAEELLPRVKAAEWRDRAEAAAKVADDVPLRDLRSLLEGASAARDDESRSLAANLRETLERRGAAQYAAWVEEIQSNLAETRVVRALRVSARPPEASSKLPPELATQLSEASGAAMAEDTPSDRWAAMLEAVAASPVRRQVKPQGLPRNAPEPLLQAARQQSARIPALAPMLGITMPPPPGPIRPSPPPPAP